MKGILFNSDMVRAVLDGGKTQTRRPIKFDKLSKIKKGRLFYSTTFDSWAIENKGDNPEANITLVECPCGKVGDRLWVQETFYCDDFTFNDYELAKKVYVTQVTNEYITKTWKESMYYKADGEPHWEEGGSTPWSSSVIMPHWASRITLEITDIRVERVQEITISDTVREGIKIGLYSTDGSKLLIDKHYSHPDLKRDWVKTWNSIYKPKGFGWDTNCYVWVIEFKVLTDKDG